MNNQVDTRRERNMSSQGRRAKRKIYIKKNICTRKQKKNYLKENTFSKKKKMEHFKR